MLTIIGMEKRKRSSNSSNALTISSVRMESILEKIKMFQKQTINENKLSSNMAQIQSVPYEVRH